MTEDDTTKLLRECDEGVKIGISSIEDVLLYVRSEALKRRLIDCKAEHEALSTELQQLLLRYGHKRKDPAPYHGKLWQHSVTRNKMMISKNTEISMLSGIGRHEGAQGKKLRGDSEALIQMSTYSFDDKSKLVFTQIIKALESPDKLIRLNAGYLIKTVPCVR